MKSQRLQAITRNYRRLRIAVVGDFCLDRYLEIDPSKRERSIETGLAVHNVVNIRAQPGGAGTVLNNLVALGVGKIIPVGLAGEDGEGAELARALGNLRGVSLGHFCRTPLRRTFTYTKPLLVRPGQPPRELSRLDIKNWTPMPTAIRREVVAAIRALAEEVDALIVLDQVDVPETGVITHEVMAALGAVARARPGLLILADSRGRLRDFPPLDFKMNAAELAKFVGARRTPGPVRAQELAGELARRNGRPIFVTLAEHGMVGASAREETVHVPALPVRGPIDIVGAGDAVTANLTAALAAGATLREALELATAAASVVIHKLGTTGTASPQEISRCMRSRMREC